MSTYFKCINIRTLFKKNLKIKQKLFPYMYVVVPMLNFVNSFKLIRSFNIKKEKELSLEKEFLE